ncbi:MAG: zinc ribbon domain-containing protein [Methanobacteriota archaeon]|nr:MAG: zinc ribbon domain-containing protein [Euryarchaeota archaeon]
MASIKCPKCAGPVTFDTGTKLVKCSYCDSQIFIDRSGAGFYYAVPFMVSEADAIGLFKRWAAGSTRAKDLDKRAEVAGANKQYFPVYMFKRDVKGREEVLIEPAGSTTLPGLHELKVPAGDLKIFDATFDTSGAELINPDIEMLSYMDSLPGEAKEQALVYFPIWRLDYVFEQKRYEVVIDASTGEVFSANFPARSSTSYMIVAIIGFLAFAFEGILALSSLMTAVTLMVLTVLGIFAISFYVARRL